MKLLNVFCPLLNCKLWTKDGEVESKRKKGGRGGMMTWTEEEEREDVDKE